MAAATWMMSNSGLSFDTDDEPDADYTKTNGAGVGIGISSGFGGSGGSTAYGSEEEGDRRKEEGVQWWERGANGAGGKLLAYEIPDHWCAIYSYIYIYVCVIAKTLLPVF